MRRLPPGMTEAEFWTILGEDWEAGKGKVDWSSYAEGKVSKEYVEIHTADVCWTDMHIQPFETISSQSSLLTSQEKGRDHVLE